MVRTRKPLDLAAVDAFRASLPVQAERSAGLVRRMRDGGYQVEEWCVCWMPAS
ncbi:MAG: hypothetical protein IPG49_16960 [Proteobacteria bacterium]|nr:hypothetical protein [Pseudomonadota bacterium]